MIKQYNNTVLKAFMLLIATFFTSNNAILAQTNQCYQAVPAGTGCYGANWVFTVIPGSNPDFIIKPGTTASFKEYSNGTATFTATVVQINDANKQLYLSLNLSGYKSYSPNPHAHDCQSPNTNSWHYYSNTYGTATGQNGLSGVNGNISQGNYPWWQVGNGANTNTMNFGASSWLHCDWNHTFTDGQVDVECNLNPVSGGQVSVANRTICQGQSTTLTASGCTGSLQWSNGSTSNSITVSPNSTTQYSVTCYGQCGTSTATGTVTVAGNPTVSASNNGPFCSQSSVQLSASANQSGSYAWSGPNGYVSFTQNPSGNLAAGTYNVVFTNSAGCKAYASTNVVITYEPAPVISVGQTNCPGTPVSISAYDPSYSFSYNWNFGSGANPASATYLTPHTVTYPTCGVRTVTLTYQKPTCKGSVSTTLNISDTQKPIIAGVPPNLTQDCASGIPSPANPTVSDNCDQNIQLSFAEYKTYPSTCSTVINRKWSATDKCGNYTEAIQTITLIDNKAPVLNNIPSDLQLNGNVAAPAVPTNITATDDCDPNITPVFSQTETINTCTKIIKRTWTAKDRCGNATTKTQDITITKPITCTASIYQNVSGNGASNGIAQVNATGGWGYYSYKWSNGAVGQYAYYLTSGTYTVTVTDNYGCSCVSTVSFNQPAKLGDCIFEDKNGNGILDAGEAGIPYVPVTLTGTDANGNTVNKTTYTDYYGKYLFDGLVLGTYKITIAPPAGYTVTSSNKGTDESKDSDIDPTTKMSNTITLTAGQNYPDLDGGLYKPAKLGDFVWLDSNKDGVSFYETGVAGVNVMLIGTKGDGTPVNLTTTTNATGYYLFDNLAPGIYCVKFTAPTGFALTGKDQLYFGFVYDAYDSDADPITGKTDNITLNSGDANLTLDAGIYKPTILPATLGDRVWEDKNGNGIQDNTEVGVPNINVFLTGTDINGNSVTASTITNNVGQYLFTNLLPGTYKVTFSIPSTYVITSKDLGTNDAIDSDVDPTTNMTANYTLTSGQSNLTVDAGIYRPACIGDFVFDDVDRDGIQDSNEIGIGNVSIQLLGTTNTGLSISTTVATDLNGKYQFKVAPGTYCIKVATPTGYLLTLPNQGTNDAIDSDIDPSNGKSQVVSVASGQNYLILDAGIYNKFTNPCQSDFTPPTFSNIPNNLTLECSSNLNIPTPAVSDNCGLSSAITLSATDSELNGNCPIKKIITRTWKATDTNGNTATVSRTITIKDTQAPAIFGVPQDVTIQCGQNIPPAPTMTPSGVYAIDNCSDVTLTFSEIYYSGSCNSSSTSGGRSKVVCTWVAKDACGNTSIKNWIITINTAANSIINSKVSSQASNNEPIKEAIPKGLTFDLKSGKTEIQVFPNPSTGNFIIDFGGIEVKKLAIFDVKGNEVYYQTEGVLQQANINLSDKQAGIYFMFIHTSEGVFTRKIFLLNQ